MSDFGDLLGNNIKAVLEPDTEKEAVQETLPASPAYEAASALQLLDNIKDVGGNTPFLLDKTDKIWLVLKGSVDLFWINNDSTGSGSTFTGKRHHLMQVAQGDVVFGLVSKFDDVSFIAVPTNGSKLVCSDLQQYIELRHQKKQIGNIANSLDTWCAHILDNISRRPPLCDTMNIVPGRDIEVSGNTVLHTKSGVLWVWDRQNLLTLFGEFICKASTVPLSPHIWGQLQEASRFSAITTIERLAAGESETKVLLSDLLIFNQTALEIFNQYLLEQQDEEKQYFLQHEMEEANKLSSALSSLSSILHSDRHFSAAAATTPFLAACQLMARESGITLPETMPSEKTISNWPDPILAFAEYVGFFVRRIALEGDWWRDMQMPVLSYYGESKQACVILPKDKGHCLLIDPANHTSQRVTAEIATHIDDTGHVFYPPFPTGKLEPFELFRFGVKGVQRRIFPIIMLTVLTGLLSLATPLVTNWILEPIIPEAQMGQLVVMICALILVGVSMAVFSFVQSIALMRMEGLITHRVQAAVWDKLLKLPASFFRKFSVGDLASRAQGIDSMRQLLTNSLLSSFVHGVTGLFSFGMMLYYNWKISLFILLIMFVFVVINYFIGKKILSHAKAILDLTGKLRAEVFRLLSAVQKFRITGSERSAFAHWASVYAPLQTLSFQQKKLNNALSIIKSVFSSLALIILLVVLAWEGGSLLDFYRIDNIQSVNGIENMIKILPMAHFVAFHVAFGQFMSAVFGLSNMTIQLLNIKPLFDRIRPILEAEQETIGHNEYVADITGDIEVLDIKFRYNQEADLILDETSLYAKPGEYIAITGPSGAGKSTLIRLLLGFDQAEAGSIFLDGKDISQIDKRSMRRHFGVVLQNGRLLSGSIFHNITAGADLSHDAAWVAAKKAGLDKDIEKMPMGMETFLSEGATTLSGGQRQRLMIARALIHKPRVIIFDEATSALDNEVQSIVMTSLDELNNTRIVIAHRLSTIVNADRIYVMDQGRVMESGNYQELMDRNGLFHEMAIRQIA